MKPLTLLKLLRQISPKPTTKTSETVGFTLIELAVVVLVIGILSAIAAPGWLAFVSRQRTRTVNDGVFRALRSAQSQAKLKKTDVTVTFTYDPSASPAVDPPKVSITGKADETLSANGEIKDGMVAFATGKCTDDSCSAFETATPVTGITFNSLGAIDDDTNLPFAVTTAIENGKGAKRCVIVQTILGSIRSASGEDCPEPSTW